jgi:hypothetical protein
LEKLWPFLITSIVALIAVAIAYRVRVLHNIVFGKGSAHLNEAAKHSAAQGTL